MKQGGRLKREVTWSKFSIVVLFSEAILLVLRLYSPINNHFKMCSIRSNQYFISLMAWRLIVQYSTSVRNELLNWIEIVM